MSRYHALIPVVVLCVVFPNSGTITTPPDRTALASPRLIMFHGDLLTESLFAHTHSDVISLLADRQAHAYTGSLDGRPFIDLKLFWHNPTWERYAQDPQLRKTLRPEDADATCILLKCSGRFYPAHRGEAAVLYADAYGINGAPPAPRVPGPEALTILGRIGLPLSLDAP